MVRSEKLPGAYEVGLKNIINERGGLREVWSVADEWSGGVDQVYLTKTIPGAIKAWYRHHKQTDHITPVSGRVLLVLQDSRSANLGLRAEFILDAAEPTLVVIPPEVWHGFTPLDNQPVLLMHLNSHAFDEQDHDEDRLPPDSDEIGYDWRSATIAGDTVSVAMGSRA